MNNFRFSSDTIYALTVASALMYLDGDDAGSLMVLSLIPPSQHPEMEAARLKVVEHFHTQRANAS